MRFSRLLRDGAVAGATAGLAAALVMWLLTEPVIARALLIEDAREHAAGGHSHGGAVVSRTAQVLVGAGTAIVAGVLFGVVFGVVFARVRHRLPGVGDHARALWLGVLGFGVFTLLPALAVPADPPGVGDPSTVSRRTLVYVLTILLGLLVVGASTAIGHLLRARGVQAPARLSAALLGGAVLTALVLWLLPSTGDRVPADVPADLVWDFRLASLAQLAVMWSVLAVVFGLLTTRAPAARRDPALTR